MDGIVELDMPRRIVYGRPAAQALVAELRDKGVERAFLLSTPSLERQPYLREIRAALGAMDAGLDVGLTAHTPDVAVIAAARAAEAAGAQALVAIGGGSVIDGAKVVRLAMAQGIATREGLFAWRPKTAVTPKTEIALIAVPTTLSAAEFSCIAGVKDTVLGRKSGLDHRSLLPNVVVLDPAATRTAPDWLILSSGIRSVDHCVEALLSSQANPVADGSALHGLTLLVENLPAMRARPDDLAVRRDLQFGMWLSMVGLCMGVPLGASHAIGRALGGVFGVPHGRTSCVMLAPVLAWNADVDEARQRRLAALFPRPEASLSDNVRALVESLGEPSRLRDVGIAKDDLERVVEPALAMLKMRSVLGNVRPVRGADDVREILELAW